jgi:hypothetical protein
MTPTMAPTLLFSPVSAETFAFKVVVDSVVVLTFPDFGVVVTGFVVTGFVGSTMTLKYIKVGHFKVHSQDIRKLCNIIKIVSE